MQKDLILYALLLRFHSLVKIGAKNLTKCFQSKHISVSLDFVGDVRHFRITELLVSFVGKENFDTSNSTVLHHSPPVRRKNVDCKDKQNKLDKDKQNKPDVHPDENSCSNSSATQRVAEDSVSKEQQIR